jgi:carbamoyltransferase
MLSLGISSFYHDSAVAISDKNTILFAAQEERFTRVKGDSGFPYKTLQQLLSSLGISLQDITHVSYYEDPRLKRQRILKTFASNFPGNFAQIRNFIETYDSDRFFPLSKLEIEFGKEVRVFKHHESHAASTFFPSPFESAAVLVIDGVGEWSTASIFSANRNKPFLSIRHEERFPDSLGLFYATMTSYSGFKVNSGEYKFMGLAPYGEAKYIDIMRKHLIHSNDKGEIKLNRDYFGFTKRLTMWHPKMERLFGFGPRAAESDIRKFDCDLAMSTQMILEEIVMAKAKYAMHLTGEKNLCLAGGVALNCVANGKLLNIIPIENIFIQPAAGDAGGALGASLFRAALETTETGSTYFNLQHGFLGNCYSDAEVEKALIDNELIYSKLTPQKHSAECAQILSADKSIGWFSGRMEFGPRALGGRSILASATSPSMQSRLNLQIKKRESFRPFAPIVLVDEVHNWFDWPEGSESKYMLFTAQVNKDQIVPLRDASNENEPGLNLISIVNEVRSTIPAITHVDLSARLQTIDQDNPLYPLLRNYFELTGVPVLVNTSFNVRNEPIVESPHDAIRCFMTTDIDALAIGSFIVRKEDQTKDLLLSWQGSAFMGELD